MIAVNAKKVSQKINYPESKINMFLKKHTTIRKIIAYGLPALCIGIDIKNMISARSFHFPKSSFAYSFVVGFLLAGSQDVRSYDLSLQGKKIEKLNLIKKTQSFLKKI